MFKRNAFLFVAAFLGLFLPASVFAAAGNLDTTFGSYSTGGPGYVTFNNFTANGKDEGKASVTQPDGKIVVVGTTYNGSNDDVLVMRYNSNGTPDYYFGSGGFVTFGGIGNDGGFAVTVQPDGKIVVAGTTHNGSNEDVLVLRYNSDGSSDSAFGTGGTVTFNGAANSYDIGLGVTVQSDGKIVVAGINHNGSNEDVLVLRFNIDGTLDSAFGTGGIVTFNGTANNNDMGDAVTIQPDGRILVAGYINNTDVLVLRYNIDGTPDSAFGAGGIAIFNIAGHNDDARAVTMQPDGKIVVAGVTDNGINDDAFVLRFNGDGTPDSAFGAGGAIIFNGLANGFDHGDDVTVQLDGKILVVGGTYNGTNDSALFLRYNSDGTSDSTFGTGGVVTLNVAGTGGDLANAVSIQLDGKIVVTGNTFNGINDDVLVLRLLGNNGVQHNAQGSYNYSGGVLSLYNAISDFTCAGPSVGTEYHTVTSLTATSMTWSDGMDIMTFTRPTGVAGDITGTWTASDPSTGNTYYLTFNTDGTFYITGYVVACDEGGTCATVVSSSTSMQNSPSMNDLGEVVWTQYDEVTGYQQIYSSTRGKLTSDNNYHNNPSINNYGDVVWEQNGNIYIKMSGIDTQLTTNGLSYSPSVNDSREVVYTYNSQIYSTTRGQLTFDANYPNMPDINNKGDVVWTQYDSVAGYDQVYKLVNGSSVPEMVTTDSVSHMYASINDSGEIAWSQNSGYGSKIYSSTRGQLTSSCPNGDHWDVSLNNCGDVAFSVYNYGTMQIYKLDSGTPCTGVPAPLVIAWSDDTYTPGFGEIFLKKSTDSGDTWTTTRLTNNAGSSTTPRLLNKGSDLFIAWADNSYGNNEILLKKSSDGGNTWTPATRMTNNPGNSSSPEISTDGANIYLVWNDNSYGNDEIFFKKSSDGGNTWTSQQLTNNTGSSTTPRLLNKGADIFVVWTDNSYGNNEILLKKSSDGGNTWTTATRITNNPGNSINPEISTDGANLYLVWNDNSYGNDEIFFKKSSDGGNTWTSKQLTSNAGNSTTPRLLNKGTDLFVVWADNSYGNDEILLKKSSDGGNTWTTATRMTNNAGNSINPGISTDGISIYLVWNDNSYGNDEILFKKSSDGGNTWIAVTRLTNNNGASISAVIK